MLKRSAFIIISACLIAGIFGGCTTNTTNLPLDDSKEYDLGELSTEISETNAFSDILDTVSTEAAVGLYGIDPADVDDICLMCSTGATTEEIGLFKCAGKEAAARVKAKAEERAQSQKTAYESYAPQEIPKLDDAVIKSEGDYVFYVVSTDSAKIEEVFK